MPSARAVFTFACVFVLLGEMARGIVLGSLAHYLTRLHAPHFVGTTVALFSVGRLAASLCSGWLANRTSNKAVFELSLLLNCAGSLLYLMAFELGLWALILARLMQGFGTGTLSVARAAVAQVSTPSQRTRYMAILDASRFIGYALSPVFGLLLTYVHLTHTPHFSLDPETSPGLLLAVLNALLFLYSRARMGGGEGRAPVCAGAGAAVVDGDKAVANERTRLLQHQEHAQGDATSDLMEVVITHNDTADAGDAHFGSPIDSTPSTGTWASGEGTVPPDDTVSDGINEGVGVVTGRQTQSGYGAVPCTPVSAAGRERFDTVSLETPTPAPLPGTPIVEPMDTRAKWGLGTLVGVNFVAKGVLAMLEAIGTPLYTQVALSPGDPRATEKSNQFFLVLGVVGLAMYGLLAVGVFRLPELLLLSGALAVTAAGCLVTESFGDLTLARLIVGCGLIWSIAAPMSNTYSVSLFSKIVGARPQGVYMSLFTSSGSVGLIVFPLLTDVITKGATILISAAASLLCALALFAYYVVSVAWTHPNASATPREGRTTPAAASGGASLLESVDRSGGGGCGLLVGRSQSGAEGYAHLPERTVELDGGVKPL